MSGPIPEEIIGEILRRVNIVEIVGEHVPLRKVGGGYQGLCPFHADSKPSFHVNEARQFFHCFGCGTGGNAFHFLMRLQQMTFPEAVRVLAGRCGVRLPERPLTPEERRRREHRESLLQVNAFAGKFFREMLLGAQGDEARRYLQRRGIPPQSQETFGLGFAPSGWRGLVDRLQHASISLSLAEQAGLIIPRREGGYYDRFRARLIFPIHDEGGRMIGFGGRALGDELPKYINSPDSPLFSKGKNLYGLHWARGPIREKDAVVVVEGYTDLIGLHEFGIRNVVATLGTALTADHLRTLKRYTPHVIHVFDADEAGERATLRALDLCLDEGLWGRVWRLPPSHDPDSYVRAVGGEAFKKELETAISLMDYWIQRTLAREDLSQPEGKIRALEQVLPRVGKLRNRVAMDHYASLLADRLRLSESRIQEMLREGPKGYRGPLRETPPEEPPRAERLLIQAILKEPSLARCLEEEILGEFQDSRARRLGLLLAHCSEDDRGQDGLPLEAKVQEPDLAQYLAGLLAQVEEVEDPERVCEDCVRHLRRKGLERKIQSMEAMITQARHQRDSERLHALELQKAELVVRKKRLAGTV